MSAMVYNSHLRADQLSCFRIEARANCRRNCILSGQEYSVVCFEQWVAALPYPAVF